MAFGAALVVLGVLRMVEHEFGPTFRGRWMSLLPYVCAIVAALVVIGIAATRITKKSLNGPSK